MTDPTGHKDRPGAGPFSTTLTVAGIATNYYINNNPETGKVEIAKAMPAGTQDALVKDFTDSGAAREWFTSEWQAGRLR